MQSKGKTGLNIKAIVKGLVWAIIISLALLLLLSYFISRNSIDESKTETAFLAVCALAGITCGISVKRISREGGSINAVISALMYALLCTTPALLSENRTADVSDFLKIIAISMVTSYIGYKVNLFKSNKKLRKKSKKR